MRTSVVLLAAIVLACVALTAASSSHRIKEQIHRAPLGWQHESRACPRDSVELTLLLRQQNVDILEQTLYAVSDPQSPAYGKHLSHEEVNWLVAPKPAHVDAVLQWLEDEGVDTANVRATPNSDMISVRLSVSQAESLLRTEYHSFRHSEREVSVLRSLSYSLPHHIADIVDVVGPTVRFPSHHSVKLAKEMPAHRQATQKTAGDPKCQDGTTPACLKSLYQTGSYVASSNTSLATTGFLEQYISPSDLATFFATLDPADAREAKIIGPNDPTNPGVEASLDIQYTMAIASGVDTTFWYIAGRMPNSTENEPFLQFLFDLASMDPAPWVISTSYGDDEHTVAFDYASRMNVEFAKAGVRGISILYSSGDGGVSGGQAQSCTKFIPTFPAGSPYVTSVGATTGSGPEVAAHFSSGGFTNYWDRPQYQIGAVAAYLNTFGTSTLPPADRWNHTSRAFPDVSAAGTQYQIIVDGMQQSVAGTSCSTPTLSGIVSLLNDIRFRAGKSALGFLNPLFYQNPQMFTDILEGNNPGCGTAGFTAVQGWDPVTGLGTPNFVAMASVVKNLP